MFVIQPSIKIISNLKELLSEVDFHINNDNIIHLLKVKLIKYFENHVNNSFPELEKELENEIDDYLPVSTPEIKDAVNHVVDLMMDEIQKEITDYLNNKL